MVKPWSNHGLTMVDEPPLNNSLITVVYCGMTVIQPSLNHGNFAMICLPWYSCGNDIVVLWLFIP